MPIDNPSNFSDQKDTTPPVTDKTPPLSAVKNSAEISPEDEQLEKNPKGKGQQEIMKLILVFMEKVLNVIILAKQKIKIHKLKRIRKINNKIKKAVESLPAIKPLPDNFDDEQIMIDKLNEIKARAEALQSQVKKLANSEYRDYYIAEIKDILADHKESLEAIEYFGKKATDSIFNIVSLKCKIGLINELHSFLCNLPDKAEVNAEEII